MDKKHMENHLADEALTQVTGGDSAVGSDGNLYAPKTATTPLCGSYRCMRCGGRGHIKRCQLPENLKGVCAGCTYFEQLDRSGNGCCRYYPIH